MARRTYDPETKAAVMAALLAGQSVSSVAREFNLPKGTVSNWHRRNGTQKRQEVGDELITLLHANIRALTAMSAVASDPEYLREQPAAELGTLFGIMHDKVTRMLQALEHSPIDGDAA